MELQFGDTTLDGTPTVEGLFDETLPDGKFHLEAVELKMEGFTVRLDREDIQQIFQAAFGG